MASKTIVNYNDTCIFKENSWNSSVSTIFGQTDDISYPVAYVQTINF